MDNLRKFDFGSDERWQKYLETVEVGPRPTPSMIYKMKAKWYKKTIDSSIDVNEAIQALQGANGSTDNQQQQQQQSQQAASQSASGSQPQSRSTPKPTSTGSKAAGGNATVTLFAMHFLLILAAAGSLVPLRSVSSPAYRVFIALTLVSQIYKIYLKYGRPASLWPLQNVMEWAQGPLFTTDLHYAMLALVLGTMRPSLMGVFPITCIALFHFMAYASAALANNALWKRFGQPAHAMLAKNQRNALLLNAYCEVGLLLYMLVSVFTSARNLIGLISVWQYLKLRYKSSDAARFHGEVWSRLNGIIKPYTSRVPLLQKVVNFGQRMFVQ